MFNYHLWVDSDADLPFVSICTPTFNRRPWILLLIECIRRQTYPLNRIEWIIADDGTDSIEDLIKNVEIPACKYFRHKKMSLGEKRNFLHSKCTGQIIVNMDDDDYYPSERVEHAVSVLTNGTMTLAKTKDRSLNRPMIAGSSEMYMYSHKHKSMYKCGPYGKNHCTAATMAFNKDLLSIIDSGYNSADQFAEEVVFLKQVQSKNIPVVQLNPLTAILVFAHDHNSCNKEDMIDNGKSTKTSLVKSESINFQSFIEDSILRQKYIDLFETLCVYTDGEIHHKPELVAQIENMKKNRLEREIEFKKKNFIAKIERGEIPIKMLDDFLTQHSSSYVTNILESKNKLIDKLLLKVKILTKELEDTKI
jgi:glycosyltransferase involved in cell wall biosynthesis